jgi:NMD protein affecting ribosome stability and mRNA decay
MRPCPRCGDEIDDEHEVCPSCCDDHDFVFDSMAELTLCQHCGKSAPDDFYRDQPGDDLP